MDNKLTNGLIIGEWITIISLFVAGFVFVQNLNSNLTTATQEQSKRTDKLYEMFIDLVKESK